MKEIEFDYNADCEGSYRFDGRYYMIQNERVFKHQDDGIMYTDELTPDQLRFHGELLVGDSHIYELKVLEIKEKADGSALIKATDGAGIDFTFCDKRYGETREKYRVGEIGKYRIFATILESSLPEDFKDGMQLEGKDAQKFFDWLDEEVEENAGAFIGLKEFACYEEEVDFNDSGVYKFKAFVNNPAFANLDEAGDEENSDLFELALMNQFNRHTPRFVTASFENGSFPQRIYENLPEDEDMEFDNGGFVIEGKVLFEAGYPAEDEVIEEEEAQYKYNDNDFVPCEAKGYYSYDDEDYLDLENGERILNPFRYFDDEEEI